MDGEECPRCGAPIGVSGEGGVCTVCALADLAGVPVGGRLPRGRPEGRFGDYELLEEIARGGMGIVYRARQVVLDRVVALKVLAAGPSPGSVARFHTEALAAARLNHPHIVPVHDFGEVDGRAYYAMEYVEGMDLADWTGGQPIGALRAAQLMEEVARAVDHAHHAGVIHRDLKPANVLVDVLGRARVTDFGLAKRMDEAAPLTVTGEVLGSPGFMPPEQAAGSRGIDRRCDVYGLGAILYYLLTGRPPFLGESVASTIHQVIHGDLAPPRVLNPAVPPDLDTVVLRCLAREPARRYATAGEVAAELERYAAGLPVRARPVGTLERTWTWCRRRPALAALAVVSAAFLASAAIGGVWFAREQQQALEEEERLRQEAEEDRYVAEVRLASVAVRDGQMGSAVALLERLVPAAGEPDRRGFEWHWLRSACEGGEMMLLARLTEPVLDYRHLPRIGPAALGSTRLLFPGPMMVLPTVPVTPPEELALGSAAGSTCLAVGVKSDCLAVGGAGGVWTVEWEDGRHGTASLHPLSTLATTRLAWSPDGRLLACALTGEGGGGVMVHRRSDASSVHAPGPVMAAIGWSAFESAWVLVDPRGTIRVWDPRRRLPEIRVPAGPAVVAAAVSHDGRYVATASRTGVLRVTSVGDGNPVAEGSAPAVRDAVVAVSEGYLAAAVSGDPRVWLYRLPEMTPLGPLTGHGDQVVSLEILGDAGPLYSCSMDGTARSWTLGGLLPRRIPRNPSADSGGPVAVFSPRGDRLVAMTRRGPGRGLATVLSVPDLAVLGAVGSWWPLGWSPSPGSAFLGWRESGDLVLANAGLPRVEAETFPGATVPGGSAGLSPDGRVLAVREADGRLVITEVSSGRRLPGPAGPVAWFQIAPDSRRMVHGSEGGAVLRDLDAGTELPLPVPGACSVTWGGDGSRVLLGDVQGGISVVSATNAVVGRRWVAHAGPVRSVAMAPDGRTVVSGGDDQWVRFWRASSGRELAAVARRAPVEAVIFSPDGRNLLVADRETLEFLGVPQPPGGRVAGAAAAPVGSLWGDPRGTLERLGRAKTAGRGVAPAPAPRQGGE